MKGATLESAVKSWQWTEPFAELFLRVQIYLFSAFVLG